MIWCLTAAALFSGSAGAASGAEPGGLPFPAPGTYKLDRIQRVPFSVVRDGPGLPHLLSAYTTGKITLLTFFYTLCTDPQGCPLAWNAFEAVREKIKADPVLHGKARLVFFSFDPVHETPKSCTFSRKATKRIPPLFPGASSDPGPICFLNTP